jgi:hypothetical protein
MLVLARVGLSSYLCTLCTIRDTPSRLGGGIHPTTVHKVDVAAGQAPMVQTLLTMTMGNPQCSLHGSHHEWTVVGHEDDVVHFHEIVDGQRWI